MKLSNRKWLSGLAVLAACAAALAGTSDTMAFGGTSQLSSSALNQAIATLNDSGSQLDPDYTFASPAPPVERTDIRVWTSTGRISEALSSELGSLGVTYTVMQARLSRTTQSDIETEALSEARDKTSFADGAHILGVNVDYVGPVAIYVDELTNASSSSVVATFKAFGDGAVVVATAPTGLLGNQSQLYRQNTVAPYVGGAEIVSAGTLAGCSSGFVGRSQTNGAYYLLTAEHCVNNNDPRFFTWPTGGSLIGTATGRAGNYDAAAIKLAVGSPYSMYVGLNTSNTTTTIDGVWRPSDHILQQICAGGAFSGEECNSAEIGGYVHLGPWTTDTGRSWPDRILWYTEPTTYSLGQLAGHGDSGGPVYLDPTTTGGQHIAIGLISQGISGEETTCTAGNPAPSCYWGIYFSDVYNDASMWNLTLS